jgi:hypothetical protein
VRSRRNVDRRFAKDVFIIVLRLAGDVRVAIDEARENGRVAKIDHVRFRRNVFCEISSSANRFHFVAFDENGLIFAHSSARGIDKVRRFDKSRGLGFRRFLSKNERTK